MTEDQVKLIRDAVDLLFKGSDVNRLVKPSYFPSLVQKVRKRLHTDGVAESLPELELHCVTAMCVLGPGRRGTPPEAMRKQLIEIVDTYAQGRLKRTLEFAVAYGCGKWRTAEKQSHDWTGEWERAIRILKRVIQPAVREVNLWFAENVTGYPKPHFWSSDDGKRHIESDAEYLVSGLLNPLSTLHIRHGQKLEILCTDHNTELSIVEHGGKQTLPPGGRAVFSIHPITIEKGMEPGDKDRRTLIPESRIDVLARDDETRITFIPDMPRLSLNFDETALIHGPAILDQWSCSCGHPKCDERHRLTGWRADSRVTLWSFLASAVKGPHRKILANTLIEGMYYPLLALEGGSTGMRVRSVHVEQRECMTPDCSTDGKNYLYEGDKCPQCKRRFDPHKNRKIADERLIVDTDYGVYKREERQRCRGGRNEAGGQVECDNLYSFSESNCPLCGISPRMRRRTYVWVRTFNRKVSLDDDAAGYNLPSHEDVLTGLMDGEEQQYTDEPDDDGRVTESRSGFHPIDGQPKEPDND